MPKSDRAETIARAVLTPRGESSRRDATPGRPNRPQWHQRLAAELGAGPKPNFRNGDEHSEYERPSAAKVPSAREGTSAARTETGFAIGVATHERLVKQMRRLQILDADADADADVRIRQRWPATEQQPQWATASAL